MSRRHPSVSSVGLQFVYRCSVLKRLDQASSTRTPERQPETQIIRDLLAAFSCLVSICVGADVRLIQRGCCANTPEDPDVHLQTSTAGAAVLAGQVANLLINLSHPARFLRIQLPAIG